VRVNKQSFLVLHPEPRNHPKASPKCQTRKSTRSLDVEDF
jgi:hypothetical protein